MEKKVALVVDNSAWLTQKEIEELNIAKVVPISFIVNGDEYYENQNMSYEDFYKFMSDKNTNVSTSQPSIENVKEEWREVLKECSELVYIPLSSGLSESCNAAINASKEQEFDGRVFVVNNQRVSVINKSDIYIARKLIDEGKTAKEVKDVLEKNKSDAGVYIAVDTLKYLKKGGRVTPAAAAIGTLLNIKPILQIHGGKLDAFAKVMSMKQAKSKMISAIKKEIEERFPEDAKQGKVYISMAHSNADVNAQEIKDFEAEVREEFKDYPFYVNNPLPLFIVCHTGPNAMAIAYIVDRMGLLKEYVK